MSGLDPVLRAAVDARDIDAVVERLGERFAMPEDADDAASGDGRRVTRGVMREAS